MLDFQANVYDLFQDLKSAMGTDPEPYWMLVYDTLSNRYSAIDLTDKKMVLDYAIRNNVKGICIVNPIDLVMVLEHEQPHLVCWNIHEWITLHTPHPYEIELKAFAVFVNNGQLGVNVVDEIIEDPDSLQSGGVDQDTSDVEHLGPHADKNKPGDCPVHAEILTSVQDRHSGNKDIN